MVGDNFYFMDLLENSVVGQATNNSVKKTAPLRLCVNNFLAKTQRRSKKIFFNSLRQLPATVYH